jgi:hypothetical protein
MGRNYSNDPNNPNIITDTSAAPVSTIYRFYRNGSGAFTTVINSAIDPTKYDNGTGTLATTTPAKFTIQRLFYLPDAPTLLGVYYGRQEYNSIADAQANIPFESFSESESTATQGIFCGWLIVQGNCTALNDTADAIFVNAGLFRNTANIGGGGLAIAFIDDLNDVTTTTPSNNQVLRWNNGTAQWVNSDVNTLPLVSSFNGLTGAVTGVASIRGLTGTVGITNGNGIGLSVSGQTMTFSNTGVLSIDGSTGAITNVARTNVNNNFSAAQTVTGAITSYDLGTDHSIILIPSTDRIRFYDAGFGNSLELYAGGNLNNQVIAFPQSNTTLAGLAVSQTFTATNTFTPVTNFASGISAAGGVTFSGNFSGATGSFSRLLTASAGISASGATFSGDIAVNGGDITTTSTTATVFNTTATTLNFGGAATTLTMGGTSGTASIRNATLRLGNTTSTITTNSGSTNSLTLQPYGNISLSPTSSIPGLGSITGLVVTNSQNATGQVQISGGDLYLGAKTTDGDDSLPVNIIFEGATDNTNETTLTVVDPTADRTITFPDASGTVALTSGLVSLLSGSTYISVSGSTGAVTITNTGVQTFNGLTGAVSGVTVGGTNVFTSLNTFNAGISAAGATFSGSVSTDNIFSIDSQLSLNDKANNRVSIGDYSGNGNYTYIYLRDNINILDISNPYGSVVIGDPSGIEGGYNIIYNSSVGYLDGGGSALTNWTSGSFSQLLTASAGISAAGGVTFGGTVASDTGYRITSNAINAQTGTTYTFIAADNGKVLTFNNGSAVTVTIPTALPVGFNCTAIQLGAGQVGFTAASGVTLNAYASGLKIAGQHGSAALISYESNVYNLSGTLTI